MFCTRAAFEACGGYDERLFGGEDMGSDVESGGRIEGGVWFDACHERGIGGRFFALGDETTEFNSAGLTNVARPFIDATPGSPALGMENALVINAPGGPTGSVFVRMTSEVFGGDVYFQRVLCRSACSRRHSASQRERDEVTRLQFRSCRNSRSSVAKLDAHRPAHSIRLGGRRPELLHSCVPVSTGDSASRTSPSSRGPGRGPFKAKTRVRIPLGTPRFSQSSDDRYDRAVALESVVGTVRVLVRSEGQPITDQCPERTLACLRRARKEFPPVAEFRTK